MEPVTRVDRYGVEECHVHQLVVQVDLADLRVLAREQAQDEAKGDHEDVGPVQSREEPLNQIDPVRVAVFTALFHKGKSLVIVAFLIDLGDQASAEGEKEVEIGANVQESLERVPNAGVFIRGLPPID